MAEPEFDDVKVEDLTDLTSQAKKAKAGQVRRPQPKQDRTVRSTPPSDDSSDFSQLFNVRQGSEALMMLAADMQEARDRQCCADLYRRQARPMSVAISELSKEYPVVQKWITDGKVFKFLAVAFALEPIASHTIRDHVGPNLEERRQRWHEEDVADVAHPRFGSNGSGVVHYEESPVEAEPEIPDIDVIGRDESQVDQWPPDVGPPPQ